MVGLKLVTPVTGLTNIRLAFVAADLNVGVRSGFVAVQTASFATHGIATAIGSSGGSFDASHVLVALVVVVKTIIAPAKVVVLIVIDQRRRRIIRYTVIGSQFIIFSVTVPTICAVLVVLLVFL